MLDQNRMINKEKYVLVEVPYYKLIACNLREIFISGFVENG